LIGRLASGTDWNFLLVGGEAEGERLARLANHLPAARAEPRPQSSSSSISPGD
jgi:hypothetical protein